MGFYLLSTRQVLGGGCWFCPNCRIPTLARFRKKHPDLWAELEKLSHTPNLTSYGFKYGKTLQYVETQLDAEDAQLKLFDIDED